MAQMSRLWWIQGLRGCKCLGGGAGVLGKQVEVSGEEPRKSDEYV